MTLRNTLEGAFAFRVPMLLTMLTVRSLWQNNDSTDLTLRFRDSSELKVHKLVVCRNDFFRAACSGSFKVCVSRDAYRVLPLTKNSTGSTSKHD